MSFINFQAELAQTNALLERIAVALERLAGPVIPPPDPPRMATLSDLTVISPEEHEQVRMLEEEIALQLQAIPGSVAFYERLQDFEEAVIAEGGSLDELPWRKRNAAGGAVTGNYNR